MILQLIAFYSLQWIKTASCRECHCDPDIKSRPVPYSRPIDDVNFGGKMCEAGQYLNMDTGRCTPCPSGSFMTGEMSKSLVQNCLPCLQTREGEIGVRNCSAMQDTEVECLKDHYRSHWSESCPCDWGQCLRCHTCGLDYNLYRDHEVIACSQFQNTKCCEERDMEVDCSPKTTHRLPLTTTPRDISTSVTNMWVPDSQRQDGSLNLFSNSSADVCLVCLLILLSIVFKAALF